MRVWHPRIESLRRLEEGEHAPRVARHVERCPYCRDRLETIEGVRHAAHRAVQIDPPANGWARVRATLEAGDDDGVPRLDTSPIRASRSRGPMLKAAVLVAFVSAAGVAALVPTSPLRTLLDRAIGAGPAVEAEPAVSGVAMEVPAAGLTVRLSGVHPDLRIHVRVADGNRLEIGTGGEAPGRPVFGLGAGEVHVSGAGPGVLRLVLPRTGGPVVVRHGNRTLIESEGGRLILEGHSVSDTAGLVLTVPGPQTPESNR